MKMLEKLIGEILLASSRNTANKILPLSFSIIFIGFRVIVTTNCEQ